MDVVENTDSEPEGVLARFAPTPSGVFAHLDAFRARSKSAIFERLFGRGSADSACTIVSTWGLENNPGAVSLAAKSVEMSLDAAEKSLCATSALGSNGVSWISAGHKHNGRAVYRGFPCESPIASNNRA